MDYSQPYGTPPVPIVMPPGTRNYSRYVNGNPVTGTEGSIPPNTAFDENQIEIIEVIQRAGLIPTHNDLTQLWQALEALFSQKYITSPIVKHVHGAGADFPDLIQALMWVAQYVITQSGYVTFMVAPGKWTYTSSVELNHANMNRIAIQGSALVGAFPTPPDFSVGGYHNSGDGSNQIIMLRSRYGTELSFTGGVSGFISRRGTATLRYLLVTGSQTGGHGLDAQDNCYLDGCAFWGFGGHGINIANCTVSSSGVPITCSYNGSCGINNSGGQFVAGNQYVWTNLVSNATCGLNNFGGFQWLGRVYIAGHGPPNGNAAIQSLQGGLVACNPGGWLQINYAGMIIAGAASILFEGCTINNHPTYGCDVYGTGTVWLNNSYMYGNGQWDVVASDGAFVDSTNTSMATAWTPPFNTYNTNGNAFMLH